MSSIPLQIRNDAKKLVDKISTVVSACDEETLIDLGLVAYETIKGLREVAREIQKEIRGNVEISGFREQVGLFAKAILKPSKPKVRSVSKLAEALENGGDISTDEFFAHFAIRAIDVKDQSLASVPKHIIDAYVDTNTSDRVEFDER